MVRLLSFAGLGTGSWRCPPNQRHARPSTEFGRVVGPGDRLGVPADPQPHAKRSARGRATSVSCGYSKLGCDATMSDPDVAELIQLASDERSAAALAVSRIAAGAPPVTHGEGRLHAALAGPLTTRRS